jgi:hypothetical protein
LLKVTSVKWQIVVSQLTVNTLSQKSATISWFYGKYRMVFLTWDETVHGFFPLKHRECQDYQTKYLKGTVSRDFRPSFFSIKLCPWFTG